ncbi:hypothetical protein [Pseudomonas sp. PLMAX]|uniref:hypothetical protein n=1 Tax=Pseudomonas sp. PLMAX TaxID=2201998 RepID=UPI0038BABED0
MSNEEKQKQLKADIDAFIQKHLAKLCGEILHWRKRGLLPKDSAFAVLAEMHSQTLPEDARHDDSFQMIELLVTLAALEAAAATKPNEPEQPRGM